jgi:hypothetical protein
MKDYRRHPQLLHLPLPLDMGCLHPPMSRPLTLWRAVIIRNRSPLVTPFEYPKRDLVWDIFHILNATADTLTVLIYLSSLLNFAYLRGIGV